MGFSDILRDLRKEKKLTQKELAAYLGLTANCVCEWENQRSEPSMATILKMCTLFEVSSDYLLGRTDDFGAVSTPANVPTLTAKEKKLLDNFREMREDLQAYFLEMSETFIQTPEYLIEQGKNKRRKV